MVLLDAFLVMFAGAIFAYLYSQEKEFIFKFIWLFVSLSLIIFSVFNNYQLSSTTYDSTSGVTTYTYSLSSNLNWLGSSLGVLLIALVVLFIWLLYKRGIKEAIR